ncbi:hypothetical protein BG000_009560, partial [Podila horticola]
SLPSTTSANSLANTMGNNTAAVSASLVSLPKTTDMAFKHSMNESNESDDVGETKISATGSSSAGQNMEKDTDADGDECYSKRTRLTHDDSDETKISS